MSVATWGYGGDTESTIVQTIEVIVPAWASGEPYLTDEALAVAAPGDFRRLAPASGTVAEGEDGATEAGDPWLLSSEAVDFEAQGVLPGMVLQLWRVAGAAAPDLYAVSAVDGGALRLRRPGLPYGTGSPPGAGTGRRFAVATLLPLIREAGGEMDRRHAIDRYLSGEWSDPPLDLKEVRGAMIAWVLGYAYLAASENAPDSQRQGFIAKASHWLAAFRDADARIPGLLRDNVPPDEPEGVRPRTIGAIRT